MYVSSSLGATHIKVDNIAGRGGGKYSERPQSGDDKNVRIDIVFNSKFIVEQTTTMRSLDDKMTLGRSRQLRGFATRAPGPHVAHRKGMQPATNTATSEPETWGTAARGESGNCGCSWYIPVFVVIGI